MRRILLALLLGCASMRADFTYRSTFQVTGGELYEALGAHRGGPVVSNKPIVSTKWLRGYRLVSTTGQHTTIVDLDTQTITVIDLARKTYYVVPFAQMKKVIDAGEAKSFPETSFKISVHPVEGSRAFGIINATKSRIDVTGGSGSSTVGIDVWIGTVPGYQQVADFTSRLAEKMGYAFAFGFADIALSAPQSLPGFDQAAKALNQSRGVPMEAAIKIEGQGRSIAEVSLAMSDFGGGALLAAKFEVPAGFKKVDAPSLPEP